MGKVRWWTAVGRSLERKRRAPGKRVFWAALVMLVTWLSLCCAASAGKRTYEVSSVRMKAKAATSAWPPYSDGTPRHVERLETVDGRWTLETSGLEDEKAESAVYGKLLDSTGRVIWEDTISDANYLSTTHPAFLTTSALGNYTRLYNLEVGIEPLLTFPSGLDDIVWSPDGTVFAVSGAGQVRIASVTGKMLGSFALPDRERGNICSAVSDSGQYFAIGEAKREPEPLPEGAVPADTYPRIDVTKRNKPADTARRVPSGLSAPSRLPMKVTYRGVSLYDRTGHLVGQLSMSRPWDYPRCLALSDEIPPRIAVATDVGISVWSADGHVVWQDSMVFGLVAPPPAGTVSATSVMRNVFISESSLSFGNQGRVFAVTQSRSVPLTFWAWDTSKGLEVCLPLPEPGRLGAIDVQFGRGARDSVEIRTDEGLYVIRWIGGG